MEKEKASKMKQKGEAIRSRRLLKYTLMGLLAFLGMVCLYNASLFSGGLPRGDDSFDDAGDDPVAGRVAVKKDFDELFDDEERNLEVPKSIPVRENVGVVATPFLALNPSVDLGLSELSFVL